MGCELDRIKVGTPVVPVGFGATAGKNQGSPGGGTKREVETAVQALPSNGLITIGSNGKGSCHGDSGGPLYIQLPEELDPDRSWRVIGATSHGPSPTDSPGQTFYSYLPHKNGVEWIEEDSGLDITPCHDADGTWNPTERNAATSIKNPVNQWGLPGPMDAPQLRLQA